MKSITFLLVAIAALAGVVAIAVPLSLNAYETAAPVFVTKNPRRIPRLGFDLRRPRRRQPKQYWRRFG
jgi:hypothetical protein